MDAIIVDDERLARAELKRLLYAHPDIHVVGEAANLRDAKELLSATAPDAVFLDIQLGSENGFQLLEQVPGSFRVVFVTAYDEHAIRAFEVNALDYLLKPVNPDRLSSTVGRLLEEESSLPLRSLSYEDRILVESNQRSLLVPVASIQCILAAGDYAELVIAKHGRLLTSRSLHLWEERLPARRFLRVHRSTIVNLEQVERLEPSFSGGYSLFLRGIAEPVAVSRRYAARLRGQLT